MGDVNTLFSYTLQGDKATPKVKQIIDKVGGNGQGLQLSPDGTRIVYLSMVGYPSFSGNLAAFNAKNLSKEKPVTYVLKDIGLTSSISFHPAKKLVAMPGVKEPAVVFDRETGERLKDRLKYEPRQFNGVKVNRVFFALDGKHLLLDCSDPKASRYLQKAEVR